MQAFESPCEYVSFGGIVKIDDAGRPAGSIDLASVPVSAPARNHAAFIWSIADLLRGDYKRSEYGRVILPLTVLRRLDGVLAPTKEQVLEKRQALPESLSNVAPILNRVTGVQFHNTSRMDLRKF